MIREMQLGELPHADGGRVDAAFSWHMKRAIEDCEDRPGDKSKRYVLIRMVVTPVLLQDGAVTDCNIECEVSSAIPKHVSRPINCRIKSGGRAVFNDMSEGDVDQKTLDQQGDLL